MKRAITALALSLAMTLTSPMPLRAIVSPSKTLYTQKGTDVPQAQLRRLKKALRKKEINRLLRKRYWTKNDNRIMVAIAFGDYKMSHGLGWLQDASDDIIYDGASESSGDTKASNGIYQGEHQFDEDWNQSPRDKRRARKQNHPHSQSEWRTCGVCSTYRFVRCYRDGGKRKVIDKWPTYGR